MFTLVVVCLISDTKHTFDFRASDIRNLILYSLGVLFIFRWLILKDRKYITDTMRNAVQALSTREYAS
jgi:hypothetical protein